MKKWCASVWKLGWSARIVGTDSTHVKACASGASEYLAEIEEEPGIYWDRLD